MKSIKKYLVAKRNDGKYFNLHHDNGFPHTTEPTYVDNINEAQLINCNEEDLNNPHHPEWYFENSRRMSDWLKNFRMIVVTETREVNEESIVGPTMKEEMTTFPSTLPSWWKPHK